MLNIPPTKQALMLIDALKKREVHVEAEHSDGHKHVDIYIPDARIYIEVDGLQHYTEPAQIIADIKRTHYSDADKFATIHITNQLIETHVEEIADAIARVVKGGGILAT